MATCLSYTDEPQLDLTLERRLEAMEQRLEALEKVLMSEPIESLREASRIHVLDGKQTSDTAPVEEKVSPEGQLQEWQLPSPSLEDLEGVAGAPCGKLTNETRSTRWFYKMEATLWDAMPLVALKIFTAQESIMVIACAIFSLSLQSLFVLILYDAELQLSKHHLESCAGFLMDAFDAQQAQVEENMIQDTFTSQLVAELLDWRVLFGHSSQFEDAITGEPLMVGLCKMSQSLMDGRAQAEIYQSIISYGLQEAGSDAMDAWISLPSGAVLALLAILVWLATVTIELVGILSFLWAMFSITGKKTEFDKSDMMRLLHVSWPRAGVLHFFGAARLGIAVILGITGVRFLVATISVSELILNTVALEVVLHVDDVFYSLLMPRALGSIVESAEEIPVRLWKPWLLPLRHVVIVLFITCSLVLSHVFFLQPMVDLMQETANVLCSGDISFSYFKDATGYVFLKENRTSGALQDSYSSYAYRAVYDATGLASTGDPSAAPLALRVAPELAALIAEFETRNFEARNEFWPICLDSDNPFIGQSVQNIENATVELLKEINVNITSCASAREFCEDTRMQPFQLWNLRSLCPRSCRCPEAFGSIIPSMPAFGCPTACQEEYQQSFRRRNCSDATSSELESFLQSLQSQSGVDEVLNFSRGCGIFGSPLRLDGVPRDFCREHGALQSQAISSALMLCPVTCGCHTSFQEGCPPSCAPSA